MHSSLSESALRKILQGEITLHEVSEGGNRFVFTMALPARSGDMEGELSLDLRVNGKKVFNLCFTIVPGWVVKSEVVEVLLISHLQGTKGCGSQIKLACRAFHDYSPRCLLLAALQGFADAFGIREIVAVCATNQKSFLKGIPVVFKAAYDDSFAKVGMAKTSVGFYSSPIPIESKPLASFKGRARARAKKRRAMRQQIRSTCADILFRMADRDANSSSGAVNSNPVWATAESQPFSISCPKADCNLTP
jgi:hypothetical protein